jgi:hypothetical protein
MIVRYRIIIGLVILVIGIWIIFDFVLKKETPFTKDSEFVFQEKTLQQIKYFAERTFNDYLSSEENLDQVRLLVNALECNHYLLYANKLKVPRFYDFINIILLPSQRNELKNKTKYVYEIKRYLRRKRNLEIKYLKYEFSKPESLGETDNQYVRIRVTRKDAENVENLVYYFKKFKQRYYLYFKKRRESIHLPLSLERPASPQSGNEQ